MAGKERLTMAQINRAVGPRKLSDGGNLWAHKQASGSVQFKFVYDFRGKRRDMGLGGLGKITLKQARSMAENYRLMLGAGLDPITERDSIRRQADILTKEYSVEQICAETFDEIKPTLKESARDRWFSPLRIHVLPKIGTLNVSDLTQHHIHNALKPIWRSKHETADKCLRRLGMALTRAKAHDVDVNLGVIDSARALLGKVTVKPTNIKAMPYEEIPDLYRDLYDDKLLGALALKFTILTALRSTPLRNARFEFIDEPTRTMRFPGHLMKGKEGLTPDFTIPLCDKCSEIITQCRANERRGYMFYGARGVISDATVGAYLTRLGIAARPHGFRSSMRTWLSEQTDCPRDVAEMMLAHIVGSTVERAYNRTDLIEQRRVYQKMWSDYVTSKIR